MVHVIPDMLQGYLARIEAALRNAVATFSTAPQDFNFMFQYALGWADANGNPTRQPSGKRIRPIMALLCAQAAEGVDVRALPIATAVELLHNFSLIHDDIQDNSPLRHGQPTVWRIWGHANAINAGDALFAMSFRALDNLYEFGVSREIYALTFRLFTETTLELTRGQHLDMQFEHRTNVTVDDYISMITGKSAALIAASAQLGVLAATANIEMAHHYHQFGLNLGIAFQIHDDILGIWGESSITGKSTATDIMSRKKSLPVLYGLSRSKALDAIYAKDRLSDEDVEAAVLQLDNVGALEYARMREQQYFEQAQIALNQAHPRGEAAQHLQELIVMLFSRQY